MTDDESHFTVEGNNKVIMSLKISKLFARPSLLWLAVREYGLIEPVFFNSGLVDNKKLYISKYLSVLQKFIQKHHKKEKIGLWLKTEYFRIF
jgi:hypothetical protein